VKLKRQSARTTFGKHTRHDPSLERSEYCISDNHSDDSVVCLGSGANGEESENESEEGVVTSVVILQSLYSLFLPPNLHREARTQENSEKRRKISNRPSKYTGSSRMTLWRKQTARRDAAMGCAMLDTFIVRKVCIFQPRDVK